MLLMSPSMPSGACFDQDDWRLIAIFVLPMTCSSYLIRQWRRLVYDGREINHPADIRGWKSGTLQSDHRAKELRMIGWRVGVDRRAGEVHPDLTAVSLA